MEWQDPPEARKESWAQNLCARGRQLCSVGKGRGMDLHYISHRKEWLSRCCCLHDLEGSQRMIVGGTTGVHRFPDVIHVPPLRRWGQARGGD